MSDNNLVLQPSIYFLNDGCEPSSLNFLKNIKGVN